MEIDIPVNNVDCVMMDKLLTADGPDYQVPSNYCGHFLLTNWLLGALHSQLRRNQCRIESSSPTFIKMGL